MQKDLFNIVNPKVVLSADTSVTDNTVSNCTAVKNDGYESLTYVIVPGTLADVDATFGVSLFESDTGAFGGEENAVDAENLIGTLALASFTFASDNKAFKLGYKGTKEWTQLRITPVNNGGAARLFALALQGHPRSGPAANPPS